MRDLHRTGLLCSNRKVALAGKNAFKTFLHYSHFTDTEATCAHLLFTVCGLKTFRSLLSKKCKWRWWRCSPPGCAQASYTEGYMSACPLFLVHFLPVFPPLLCAVQSKAENAKRGNVQELDFSWACVWFCGLPALMLSVRLHLRRIPVKHCVPTCLWWRTQSAIWASYSIGTSATQY